jgi:hypothetical protein
MKRSLWAGALLIAAIAPWSVAQANGGVTVSVSTPEFGFRIGAPFYGPVYPAPVYVPPPRVYVPAPVYAPAHVYAPAPVYLPPRYVAPRVVYAPYPVVYPRPYRHDVRYVNWHGKHRPGRHRHGHGHDD